MTDTARHYPQMPPMLDGEGATEYTNRLLGAYGKTPPYDHERNRQCAIGRHAECSDPGGTICECPCHRDPLESWNWPKRFQLHRDVAAAGSSAGTGIVADGVVWPDGTVSVRWRGDRASTVFWDCVEDAVAVHGHAGSRFEWLDGAP